MTASARVTSVADVMTSRVRTARPDQSLHEVWYLLGEEHCHHLPIVEDDRVVGMISSRDLVSVARELGVSKLSASAVGERTAGEVMTPGIETIDQEASIDEAIDRIGRGDLHALVVVDDDERLAGIVTDRDLLQYLVG
jgi:acetoin utilization protein AcuB